MFTQDLRGSEQTGSRDPARRNARFPLLVGLSLFLTFALGLASNSGLVSIKVSALVTVVLVLTASVLALARNKPGLGVRLFALILAAPPALILAASIMMIAGRLGLPLEVVTTRLAAVSGWWLALAILRPLIQSIGSRQMPLWLSGLVMVPSAGVLVLAASVWNTGSSGSRTAQRLAYLYGAEDNATWVSHAYAMLRNGHIPARISESEYFSYSALSSMPGVLGDIAFRGRPSNQVGLTFAAVDVTVANQLLAVVVAAGLLGTVFLAALTWIHSAKRPSAGAVLLLSAAVTGVGASIAASTPELLAGHMSLAWTNVAILLLGFTVVLAIKANSWKEFVPFCAACSLAAYACTSSWVYVIVTPVVFATFLVLARRSDLRPENAEPIGHGPRTIVLALSLVVAALVAGAPQLLSSLSDVGLKGLTGATGGIAAVEPLSLTGAIVVCLGAGFLAYRRADLLGLVSTLLFAAAAVSAMLVFCSEVLPGNSPTYALTKSLYVLLATSPLAAIALVAQATRSARTGLIVIGVLVTSTLITTSPTFGSVLKWPTSLSTPVPATADRILQLTSQAGNAPRIVCQPSPYIGAINNYLCNRWTDAFSPRQGAPDFRLNVLSEGGNAPKAWAAAQASGYLRGAAIGDASEITTGSCIPAQPAPDGRRRVSPRLDVAVAPTDHPHLTPRIGHIDAIQRCSEGLTVIGWAPFTKVAESVSVWAQGPVTLISAMRTERPDILAISGNQNLLSPGFVVVLHIDPARDSKLCLSLPGAKNLAINGSDRAGCTGP